jgi:hypothetical protein
VSAPHVWGAHGGTQRPPAQIRPAAQARPQAPQLLLSECRSVQLPLQQVGSLESHGRKQPPQFSEWVRTSTQRPLQQVSPGRQQSAPEGLMQRVVPAGQALPQARQQSPWLMAQLTWQRVWTSPAARVRCT